MNSIDSKKHREYLLDDFKVKFFPIFSTDQCRSLLKKYKTQLAHFKKIDKDWWADWRSMLEVYNEIVVAIEILKKYPQPKIFFYESIGNIDFYIKTATGEEVFVEVKSINPEFDQKSGKSFEEYIPTNHTLIMDPRSSYDDQKSREKMISYTLDFEDRIEKIKESYGAAKKILVFCTNRAAFAEDNLEDFITSYRGRDSIWDHWREVQKHYLNAKNKSFAQTIDSFARIGVFHLYDKSVVSDWYSVRWNVNLSPDIMD